MVMLPPSCRSERGSWTLEFCDCHLHHSYPQVMMYFLCRARFDRILCRSVWQPGRHEWCSTKTTSVDGHDMLKNAVRSGPPSQ